MQTDTNLAAATQGADADSKTAPSTALPRWERIALLLSLLAFALLYAGIAGHLNGFHGFWSSDNGARFAMIRNWQEHGNLIYLRYDNADVDPEGRLHPIGLLTRDRPGPFTRYRLAEGYIVHLQKGFCTHFPPLFPFLSGICYHLFGFGGLTLLPLLAGLGTLLVTYALAKQLGLRSRLFVLIAMGAATPLLIYSVVFWDHTLHTLLTAIIGYFLLRALQTEKIGYGIGAGVGLGVGVFFHEMFGALFFSLLVGSVVIGREKSARRAVFGMIAGFAPLLLFWGVVNWWIYGIARGPHLTVTSDIAHTLDFSQTLSTSQVMWRLLLEVVGYEPNGNGVVIAIAGVLALLYVACLWRGRWGWQVAPLILLLLVPLTLGWLRATDWAHGLFEVAPLLIPALAFPTFGKLQVRDTDAPAAALPFTRWIGVACLVFGMIVIVNPQDPGLDWGSRYLLTMLPLVLLLAARALEGNYARTTGIWRIMGVATVLALAGVGVYANARGVQAVAGRMAESGALAASTRSITQPAIVFDKWFFGSYMVEPPRGRVFLARDYPIDVERFLNAMDKLGISEFAYAGTESGLDAFTQIASQHQPSYRPAGLLPSPQIGMRFTRQP